MRVFTSTSEARRRSLLIVAAIGLTLLGALPRQSLADDSEASPSTEDRTVQPEDKDLTNESPFTRYGEFNEEEDEANQTRFFQYGRLFGVSIGSGFQGATGNRGALWQGGFPLIDFKVHYWFDFNFALDLALTAAPHQYQIKLDNPDRVSVTMTRLALDLKYYFNTRDLSAPISFSNPYLIVGFGTYSKQQASQQLGRTDQDAHIGFAGGAGFEFAVKPKKTYIYLEGMIHSVTFKDTYDSTQATATSVPHLADLTGLFYTLSTGVLFTW